MKITSPEFEDGGEIPEKFTCDGEGVSPALRFEEVSAGARSLVLIMEDPDVPAEVRADRMWDHWVVFDIDAGVSEFGEGAAPEGGRMGVLGRNTGGGEDYGPPCPPPQYEPAEHRYVFKLFALDAELGLDSGATKAEVEAAMEGHVLAEAQLVGRYSRR